MLTLLPDLTPGAGRGHAARCDALRDAWRPHPGATAWTVVDSYRATLDDQRSARRSGGRVLVIDDHGSVGAYDADLVLDQNLGARPEDYTDRSAGSRALLGPDFLLLRRQFTGPLDVSRRERRVVLSGGGQPSDAVARLLGDVGERLRSVGCDVVELRDVADVAQLLGSAALLVGAAGSTAYEACCVGTPSLLFAVAGNQEPLGERLAVAGAAHYAGRIGDLDAVTLAAAATAMLDETAALAAMSDVGRRLVDAQGAARVAAHMRSFDVHVRPVELGDRELLWHWANDEGTRRQSIVTEPIGWDEHCAWFARQAETGRCYVASAAGAPVGHIRFDERGEVSFLVAPERRGEGWGAPLLIAGVATQPRPAFGRIKSDNAASQRCFDLAGLPWEPRVSAPDTVPASVTIAGRHVGPGHPAFLIAELSANHGGSLERAIEIVRMAAAAGADAVKLQTYTPDSMTLASDDPRFVVGPGNPWSGRRLHELYAEAAMPWEWHRELADVAHDAGIIWFSSPFDAAAVDFLVGIGAPALKIASFELVDLPLVAHAASTGLPLVMSTGMATAGEIDDAVTTARAHGDGGVALLRCNSAYPAPVEQMDLRTMADMADRWGVPVGLSDHTLDPACAVTAVALGASIVEKHVTLARADGGPDSSFSLEPGEWRGLVRSIRAAEAALGGVRYGPSDADRGSLAFRRSLYVVEPVVAGEPFTGDNLRSLRPAGGLAPKHLAEVVGRAAARDVAVGEPLTWDLIS